MGLTQYILGHKKKEIRISKRRAGSWVDTNLSWQATFIQSSVGCILNSDTKKNKIEFVCGLVLKLVVRSVSLAKRKGNFAIG